MCEKNDQGQVIFRSDSPSALWCYTPAILKTSSGRLIVTMDVGGPALDDADLNLAYNPLSSATKRKGIGKILSSDDQGHSWNEVCTFPFWHARPFESRGMLYVIGNAGGLYIIKSEDDGNTWSAPHALTEQGLWHAAATNVLQENGFIYLCMDLRSDRSIKGWNVAGLTPVILRGNESGCLLEKTSWTFSHGLSFIDMFGNTSRGSGEYFGIPFYPSHVDRPMALAPDIHASPPGWLEGNIVRITDPRHIWYDPNQKTLHIILRANTNGAGYAAVIKAVERQNGDIFLQRIIAPSGRTILFIPFPGGGMKFYIAYDPISSFYWLATSIVTDSMCLLTAMPKGRYNLPSNQRNILGLFYSMNCVDWLFADVISKGKNEFHARNYPAFIFDGEDILLVSRSGDDLARDGQYTNLITLHRIEGFRRLAKI